MAFYTVTVSATSNGSANTDDTFIELIAAAGSAIKIHKVEASVGTVASDTVATIKLTTATGAGATGSAFTPKKVDEGTRAASFTANVKNGTNAFSVGAGTENKEIDGFNGRATWRWQAGGNVEPYRVAGAGYFAILIQNTSVSTVHKVTCLVED